MESEEVADKPKKRQGAKKCAAKPAGKENKESEEKSAKKTKEKQPATKGNTIRAANQVPRAHIIGAI